jgi:hypothetical protein
LRYIQGNTQRRELAKMSYRLSTPRQRPIAARWLPALALCLSAVVSGAQEQSLEFKGSSNMTTPKFTVEAPWILDWSVFSDFLQSVSIEIALLDGTTSMHKGLVVQTKGPTKSARGHPLRQIGGAGIPPSRNVRAEHGERAAFGPRKSPQRTANAPSCE